MNRALVAALVKLIEGQGQTPDQTCPASVFTAAQREALDDLGRRTGALRVRPQGRGSVYQVVNIEILRSHLYSMRPQRTDEIEPGIPRRASNIARSRSSKGGAHSHEIHYLLVKATSGGVVWDSTPVGCHDDGKVRFNLSESTRTAGAGVLAIRQDDEWISDGPLWLVENQALFDRLDWLPSGVRGTVAYYGGQLPGRLLNWLAQRPRAPEVIIFPDYDGVGLLNYAKLLATCCSPCTLWLMPNWQRLLKTYGSSKVWQNTLPDFKTAYSLLMTARAPESVMELCAELSRLGLALEHEAVWLEISHTEKQNHE